MTGRDLLLEYAFPIEAIEPLAAPSTEYLKNVCVVAKPKVGQEANVGTIYECLSMIDVAVRTDNINAQQLFDGGLYKVYVLLADDLTLITPLSTTSTFFTLLISDDFVDADISAQATLTIADMTFTAVADGLSGNSVEVEFLTGGTAGSETVIATATLISVTIEGGVSTADQIKAAIDGNVDALSVITTSIAIGQGAVAQALFAATLLAGGAILDVGTWGGVVGVYSKDITFLTAQAVITNRTAFFGNITNKAKNMFFAFGKLLSGRDWQNQQYIEMPANDGIDDLSEAENLYASKISFVINSTEYSNRLALFTNNRKAIVAPYIYEWFQLSMQGWGVQYIALNQPKYTLREASLLQDFLEEKAEVRFITPEIVEVITISITLVEDNFIANGDLVISEPKALWRVNAKLQQGLI